MFKTNTTLQGLKQFLDDKEAFLGGKDFTKEDIEEMIEAGEDMAVEYETDHAMIVEAYSSSAIKKLGCNSLWCFTYGGEFDRATTQWYQYSANGMVYVIIDFREKSDYKEFMYVLIRPLTDDEDNFIEYSEENGNEDEIPLFDMSNENYYDPYLVLEHIFGSNYETVIRDHLNFGY